jgi:hypothetical protein
MGFFLINNINSDGSHSKMDQFVNNVEYNVNNYVGDDYEINECNLELLYNEKHGTEKSFNDALTEIAEDVLGVFDLCSNKYVNMNKTFINDENYFDGENIRLSDDGYNQIYFYLINLIFLKFNEKYDIDLNNDNNLNFHSDIICDILNKVDNSIYWNTYRLLTYDITKVIKNVDIVLNKLNNLFNNIYSKDKYEFKGSMLCIDKFDEYFNLYEYVDFDFFNEFSNLLLNCDDEYKIKYIYSNKKVMELCSKFFDVASNLIYDLSYTMINFSFLKNNIKNNYFRNNSESRFDLFTLNMDNIEVCKQIIDDFALIMKENNNFDLYKSYRKILERSIKSCKINNNFVPLIKSNEETNISLTNVQETNISLTNLEETEFSFTNLVLNGCNCVLDVVCKSLIVNSKDDIFLIIIQEFDKFVKNNTFESEIFNNHIFIRDLNNNILGIQLSINGCIETRMLNIPERMIEHTIYINIMNRISKYIERNNLSYDLEYHDVIEEMIVLYYMYNYELFSNITREFFYKYNDTSVPYYHDNEPIAHLVVTTNGFVIVNDDFDDNFDNLDDNLDNGFNNVFDNDFENDFENDFDNDDLNN